MESLPPPPTHTPSMQSAMDVWQRNLAELEGKYRITNKILLAKSSIVLLVVILLFFLSNVIPKVELDLGKPPVNVKSVNQSRYL